MFNVHQKVMKDGKNELVYMMENSPNYAMWTIWSLMQILTSNCKNQHIKGFWLSNLQKRKYLFNLKFLTRLGSDCNLQYTTYVHIPHTISLHCIQYNKQRTMYITYTLRVKHAMLFMYPIIPAVNFLRDVFPCLYMHTVQSDLTK